MEARRQTRSTSSHQRLPPASAAPISLRRPAITGIVRSTAGSALSRATVCVVAAPDSCCEEARCELTDDEGRFALGVADADVATLLATASGYVPRRQRGERSDDSGRPISVEIRLEPGGEEIAGRVVDASGGPVAGAVVTLSPPNAPLAMAVVISRADGQFSAHVPAGVFDVIARAEAYSQAARRARSPARDVTLAMAPAAAIIGKVVAGATEESVAFVNVGALLVHDSLDLSHQTSTAADGTFRLAGLPGGGLFRVEASGAAWRGEARWVALDVGQTSDFIVLRASPATPLVGHVTVAGEPCPDASVTATGPMQTSVQGSAKGVVQVDGLLPGRYEVSVRCPTALPHHEVIDVGDEPMTRRWSLMRGASVKGRLEGPDGMPVAGALIVVSPADALSAEASVSCPTIANGEFRCVGLSPGEYDCSVSSVMGAERDIVRVALPRDADTEVVLRAPPVGTIRARIAASARGSSNVHWVFARRSGDAPVEGIPLAGGFVFERMPMGRYEVYANLPPADGHSTVAVLQHHEEVVELELEPPPALTIAGRALDESGAPWLDAWVSIRPSDDFARAPTATEAPTLTDDHGEFVMSGLAPGLYDLQVESSLGGGVLQGVRAGSNDVVLRKAH